MYFVVSRYRVVKHHAECAKHGATLSIVRESASATATRANKECPS